jgi:predicted permease
MRREMDEEMRTHLALHVEYLRARGRSEADAHAEALRRFGDPDEYRAYADTRASRQARWRGIVDWVDEWTQDVRFANRQFRRNAGFTALAVLTLALGIGANTAIFTVVHRLLIAPLPYADGNRIVKLVVADGANMQSPNRVLLQAWRDRARSLELVAGISVDALYLQDFGDTQDSIPAYVSHDYLTLLGLQPAWGRTFRADEARPGAPAVAMISYGKWQREFGGRRDVIGSTIRVPDTDNRPFTVIGVMPPEVSIPMAEGSGVSGKLRQAEPAIWIPASLDSMRDGHVFAKLRRGITAEQASRELQSILETLPAESRGGAFRADSPARVTRARAMRAQDFLDARETQTVQVLFVAVGVLLLVACANVANLLMSRAWTRRREFAVRTALGAGRGRLARQVLTESILLALGGGVLGVAVAWATLKVIIALRPPALEHLDGVALDSSILVWSAAISVVTGILFGSAPALFAGARPLGEILRSESRTASGGSATRRLRSGLIVLEIALSLVLLIGAGLLVRSFIGLQRMPLGFQPHGLVSADVMFSFRREWTPAQREARRNELLDRLRAVPGVTDVGIGMMPGQGWRALSVLESDPDANGNTRSISEFATIFITPNYFRIAGMSLVAGRLPDSLAWPRASLGEDAPPSAEVVVSRALAQRFWPDGRAIGARINEKPTGPFVRAGRSNSYTVVGVVDDARLPGGRDARWTMEMYTPMPMRLPEVPLVLRTNLPGSQVIPAIRRVVAEFDRTFSAETRGPYGTILREVTVGDTYLNESLAPTRFAMALLGAFSALALVLSGVGLYGVIAYSVTQRTREIGVRVALGADAASVRRLVVGDGLRLTTVGVVLGVVVAAASTRVLAHLLYGVSPLDPESFIVIVALVIAIAFVASWVPARRAVRIDPMEALRAD